MSAGKHELGRIVGEAPGPTLVVIGGMHGNEPAGVEVARRVLADLRGVPLRGEFLALAGNVEALAAGRRYLSRDLNRIWTDDRLADALATPTPDPEQAAARAMSAEIKDCLARARGPVFVLDLHTTSAEGAPFIIVGPGAAERAFAAKFPLPTILGMHERLVGVLVLHLAAQGVVGLAIEGGQSASPDAPLNLEAVVRVGLAAAGLVDETPRDAVDWLIKVRGELPTLIEVAHRQEVHNGFRMEPGFANIQRVPAGTLLAHQGDEEIRAPFDGVVLLPLYQSQGQDGFFYGRVVAEPALPR